MDPSDKNAALTPPAVSTRGEAGYRTAQPSFLPGHVFAGRYRMVTRIGRGGMAEVWRADDLVLDIPIALKLIYSASHAGRERVIQEVRLARQITHPAICRVFDVGEADGQVFYSMELVGGEDLATLIRRAGRLPPEKVEDIARQLSAGLAAAHAHGVLHRDLKPANVLVDENGQVRITDFGIAIAASEGGNHALVGTPGYMAPEQLMPGAPLSERTDVYAFGVLLYELLVGRLPSQVASVSGPPKPSTMVPGVSPRLEQIILRALASDPKDRPASAAAIAQELAAVSPSSRRRSIPPWVAGIVIAAAVGIAAVAATLLFTRHGPKLTDQDTIVLADFTNTTGESVFDRALKVALAVALEQSPFLKVFADDRVQETLRLMERRPDEPITPSVARDVARREGLKALVTGSISKLGSHYVIALEATTADTGEVMAREQVEASSKEEVLTSLGGATARLREKLGESLASVQKFDAPLPQATTASLEALNAYSLALDEGRAFPRVEAIPYLVRAIELDPNFAMAHAFLSAVYANTGRSLDAPAYSKKAFELRDRVSERERFFISWRYYIDAEQAWDKGLDLARSWTTTYPREAFAFNSLALASNAFGQREEGVRALREAIRLDSRFVPPYGNLVGSLIGLNRFDEAKTALRDAASQGISVMSLRRSEYTLAYLENDTAGMTSVLDQVRQMPEPAWAAALEAKSSVFGGQVQRAHGLYQTASRDALNGGMRELAAQWLTEDAESHAVAGQCEETLRELPAALEISRDVFTVQRAVRSLALCGASARSATLSSELTRRFPNAFLTTGIQLPVAEAAGMLARDEPSRAVTLLEPVKSYDHAPSAEFWPSYLRGQAYLGLGNAKAAAAQFKNIQEHRGEAPTSPLYPLAMLGLARTAVLENDTQTARSTYEAFFALWSGADPDLQPLKEAREAYGRLQ